MVQLGLARLPPKSTQDCYQMEEVDRKLEKFIIAAKISKVVVELDLFNLERLKRKKHILFPEKRGIVA
jgi:hypothetical protein